MKKQEQIKQEEQVNKEWKYSNVIKRTLYDWYNKEYIKDCYFAPVGYICNQFAYVRTNKEGYALIGNENEQFMQVREGGRLIMIYI